MTIWILAVVLMALVGSSGLQQGALRMLITFVGAIVSAFLAVPLSPVVRPLVAMVGFANPLWEIVLPPLIVFIAISIVFTSIAQYVHLKVSVVFKYKRKEDEFFRWERMNRRIGVCIGLLTAMLYMIFIAALAHSAGYLTTQIESKSENPAWVRVLNALRTDAQSSGLSRFSAAMNPLPPTFYDGADLLGLVYHNPDLLNRAVDYPPFLSLAEHRDIQALLTDTNFFTLARGQANIMEIYMYPKMQTIVTNAETMGMLRGQFETVEAKDFLEFLKTGVSPKFAADLILGRWTIDVPGTVSQFRRLNPTATIADLNRLRAFVARRMSDLSMAVTPDGRASLKGVEPNVPAYAPWITSKVIIPALVGPGATNSPAKKVLQGSWTKADNKYQVKLSGDKGERSGEASVEGSKLVVIFNKDPVVFEKD
jgi:hypothetical protein